MKALVQSFPFYTSRPCKLTVGKRSKNLRLFGASNHLELACGLMFRKLRSDEMMLFVMPKPQHLQLHMLFVFHSIDVVFGKKKSKNGFEVVKIVKDFKPFSFVDGGKGLDVFLEMPPGASDIFKVGDIVSVGVVPGQ